MTTIITFNSNDSGPTVRTSLNTNFLNLNTDKIGSASPTITTPKIVTSINDSNGNESIKITATTSAVDELTVINSATGLAPNVELNATGDDTNIAITLAGKGTGPVRLGQATSSDVRLLADQPIADSSGNEFIKFSKTATAVNEITVTNAATGTTGPMIASSGETNVDLRISAAGSGKVAMQRPVNFGSNTAYFTAQTATGDGTTTIDWSLGNKFHFTFGAFNETFTFTAPPGPCSLVLWMKQDGTGSRTATWPAAVHWSAGTAPTLTTTLNKVDIITFYYDGTTYFGNSSLNYTA